MNEIVKILLFMVSCILTNNFIFSRFLGCCPFLGVSNKVGTSLSMGLAVTFVMTIASFFCYMIYNWLLVPLEITFMSTIAFILVIASLVQFVEMFLKKSSPTLYTSACSFARSQHTTTEPNSKHPSSSISKGCSSA